LTFTSLFPNSSDPTHAIFVYQRSSHLARRQGNEVLVVSPVPYFPRWLKTKKWQTASELPEQEVVGNLTVHHPRYPLLPKISMPLHGLSMFLGSLRCVAALNRQTKIDCIDAHFVYPDGFAAILLGKYLDVPVTVSARGTDINLFPSFRLIRPMIRWTLRHADGVIAVSAALRDAMACLGLSKEKIHLIPNAVDTARFRPIPTGEARQRLNLPEGCPLLVSVGSLIEAKGHQLTIRAMALIGNQYPSLRLYIIGEGPYRTELERLIKSLGLQGRVQLLGKRPNEELPFWFCAASLSCLASSREGWPNVVTESLACGTPVVATRIGGIPEILRSPELGTLVEQTSEDIALGIVKSLDKEWDRQAISREASARTWETVAEEVEEVLSNTIKQTASEAR
jgi:teichuronic acid biosynthesis glycosyltransferase TuaC